MNVTLRQLRAFIAVARSGSFTLAAESLFVTQSQLNSALGSGSTRLPGSLTAPLHWS